MVKLKFSSKYFLFLLPFLIILYFESISLGAISIGVAWKMVFLGISALFILVSVQRRPGISRLNFIAYLIGFKALIYANYDGDWLLNLSENVKYFSLPLIMHVLYIRQRSEREIISELTSICLVLAFVSTPFLLGLIEPLGNGYNLGLFGLDAIGFVGIFQGPHSAAITLALSLTILFCYLPAVNNIHKSIFFVAIVISLISVYFTFVRTGWLMCLTPFFFWLAGRFNLKKLFSTILILALLVVSFYFIYQSSELLKMRLTGTNIYSSDKVSLASIGSGRPIFWAISIVNWFESGPLAMFIGSGRNHTLIDMQEKMGASIVAHNGFIDALHANGLLGLGLLLLFFKELFSFTGALKAPSNNAMYKAFIFAYLIYIFVQGTQFFLVDVLLAYVITSRLAKGANKHGVT